MVGRALKRLVKKTLRPIYHAFERRIDDVVVDRTRELSGQVEREIQQLNHRLDRTANTSERLDTTFARWSQELSDRVRFQHAVAAVNSAAFSQYKGVYSGRDVAVIGSGPSLDYYEPTADAIQIGVNGVFQNPRIQLDHYFVQDFLNPDIPFLQQLGRVGSKIFLGTMASSDDHHRNGPESLVDRLGAVRYYFDVAPSERIYPDIRFFPLADFFTVMFPALQFALWTNPKRLYLVGCDTSFFGHFGGTSNVQPPNEMRTSLFERLKGYLKIKEFACQYYPDTRICSVNPVNLRGLFDDEYTESFSSLMGSGLQSRSLFVNRQVSNISDDDIREFVEAHIAEVLR